MLGSWASDGEGKIEDGGRRETSVFGPCRKQTAEMVEHAKLTVLQGTANCMAPSTTHPGSHLQEFARMSLKCLTHGVTR